MAVLGTSERPAGFALVSLLAPDLEVGSMRCDVWTCRAGLWSGVLFWVQHPGLARAAGCHAIIRVRELDAPDARSTFAQTSSSLACQQGTPSVATLIRDPPFPPTLPRERAEYIPKCPANAAKRTNSRVRGDPPPPPFCTQIICRENIILPKSIATD